MNAALELKTQIEKGLMPRPDTIFCPVGSNGTLAGLLLGMHMTGMESEVIGVRVSISRLGPFQVATPAKVQSLASATRHHLKKLSCELPAGSIPKKVSGRRSAAATIKSSWGAA